MDKKNIWMIVALVGGYILCQAIADIGATKLVTLAGITMPAGTFIFAITFTLRDLVHKRLGKEWARAAIFCAGAFNLLQAFHLAAMAKLPSPAYFAFAEAWGQIFAIVPAITLGSIIAELVSELLDTEVYHPIYCSGKSKVTSALDGWSGMRKMCPWGARFPRRRGGGRW